MKRIIISYLAGILIGLVVAFASACDTAEACDSQRVGCDDPNVMDPDNCEAECLSRGWSFDRISSDLINGEDLQCCHCCKE